MKKLLILVSLAFATLFASAQEVNYFTPDEYGLCDYKEEIPITMPQSTAMRFIQAWLDSNIQTASSPRRTENSISFPAVINTKSRYNPFAGSFIQNLTFDFTIKVENSKVILDMKGFGFQDIYQGFGAKNSYKIIGDVIKEIESMKEQMESGNLSKKEKKSLQSDIDDIQDEIDLANKELHTRLEALRAKLK